MYKVSWFQFSKTFNVRNVMFLFYAFCTDLQRRPIFVSKGEGYHINLDGEQYQKQNFGY